MAGIDDLSTTAASNVSIGGVSVPLTGMAPDNVDDALRMLAELIANRVEVSVASAATTNVLGAASDKVAITGTTTITSLGTGINRLRFVRFAGALTLTHNSTSLILPTGANITTAAGDTMIIKSDGSSNVRVMAYQTANGMPLGASTFARTILDDANAAAVRTTIGALAVTNPTVDGTLIATTNLRTNNGVVYLNSAESRYLQYDGTKYVLPSADLHVGGSLTWTAGQAAQSNGESGYMKLPNGIYVQWGKVTTVSADQAINLPIAFPTAAWVSFASARNNPAATTAIVAMSTLSTTQITISLREISGGAVANLNGAVNWFALGN